jgi:class 3 adenylate cyclase
MLSSRLKSWLTWQPQPAEMLGMMRPVKPWPVQMDRYTRGINNTHIDIHISPRFASRARSLVKDLVHHDVASNYWGESERQPRPEQIEEFRLAYCGLIEGAMKQRQQIPPADWVRLAQLSLLKFLLLLVPEQIHELRRSLETARDDHQSLEGGRRLEIHERLVMLAREEHAIAYRVYRRIFKTIEKLETMQLRKLRKSLIGVSWPLPREALFNVLLQLPNLLAEVDVMHHYPMLYIEEQGKSYLNNINRCITNVFHDYLPTWTRPSEQAAEASTKTGRRPLHITERLDQGGLRGFLETEIILRQMLSENEYKMPQYSWLDDSDNLAQFLGSSKFPLEGRATVQRDERLIKHWQHFSLAIREELYRRVNKMQLMSKIVASYWTPRLFQELSAQVPARVIYDYLTGQLTKRKILRRLAIVQREIDPGSVVKTLDFAASEIRQIGATARSEYIDRVLLDFLNLRRDLKLAYKTFQAMDEIRILTDDEEINLSRANGLLFEFQLPDEETAERRIRTHAILKADLRGSTRITAELRQKKLNPATHFSQNFFNPINKYLDDFGANKVFVEGDAVILSFMEYTDDASHWLCVANACGMASLILEVVKRQNLLNRRHGLPDLELGLGIAFCDEEPTFLYDEDRQITISPAINLADRLSSCSHSLRDAHFAREGRPFRVEVMLPARVADLPPNAKTEVLRYNINGVEMDQEAFSKLKTELVLQKLDIRVAGRAERFHVGRYPDRNGRLHWLVVRESPMHYWENDRRVDKTAAGRRFYEAIVDPSLITLIRSKMRGDKDGRATASAVSDSMATLPGRRRSGI